jgi:hypothetical protein
MGMSVAALWTGLYRCGIRDEWMAGSRSSRSFARSTDAHSRGREGRYRDGRSQVGGGSSVSSTSTSERSGASTAMSGGNLARAHCFADCQDQFSGRVVPRPSQIGGDGSPGPAPPQFYWFANVREDLPELLRVGQARPASLTASAEWSARLSSAM